MTSQLSAASKLAVLAVVVFLLATVVATSEKNEELQRQNRSTLQALTKTNDGIVSKLTAVFETAQRAEDAARAAGTVPATTVASIVESLRGYVDPSLIDKAIAAAKQAVAGQVGPRGAPGAQGPAGPAGTATATSTTVPAGTTSSTRPAATTTSTARPTSSTTTTTALHCTVSLLGLCL